MTLSLYSYDGDDGAASGIDVARLAQKLGWVKIEREDKDNHCVLICSGRFGDTEGWYLVPAV